MPRNKEFDYEEKLEVAKDLFWKKGYAATSMADLVDAMNINKSSLYQTYGSKHDLFLKSLIKYLKEKEKAYEKAAGKSEDPLKAVKNVVSDFLNTVLQDNKTCLAVTSTFELVRDDQEVRKLIANQTLVSVSLFEKLLEKAAATGALTTKKDLNALAHFIVLGMASIWYTHILFDNEALTKQMTKFLLESIEQ